MEELKNINLNELNDKIISISSKPFNLVSVDYDHKDGVKLFEKIEVIDVDSLTNSYKIFIFNDDFMMTVYNFGKNDFKYSVIRKDDFGKSNEKFIYMKIFDEQKKLKLRVGRLKENEENREIFQYISIDKEGK